jgi:DNA (cytosine-5)-methyltransferase 1
MELAGHECVGFCEWDKFAAASYTSMHLITDEQRSRLADMDLKARQKEILKEEYRNGEWYSADVRLITADNMPRADCWCFGAPCQDFSIAGERRGLDGDRSSLVREVFRVLGELKEEDRPEWLIYENVKGMLSSNRGFDFLAILLEMDELGYDIEWQIFNTKNFGVPQNRERVYTVGHLRSRGRKQIFPLKGTDGEDSVSVKIIGHKDGYRRNTQVFAPNGITEALDTAAGGGRGHHTIVPVQFGIDFNENGQEREISNTLTARYNKGCAKFAQTGTAVAIPVLTPDRAEKRQNGRRFKDNGEEAFTLTAQDRHGVALKVNDNSTVYAVWYEKYQCYIAIRKLTPRECFRLQGWTDDYFEKAAFVNSDSQLYKQAGNGVTVDVVAEIAKHLTLG